MKRFKVFRVIAIVYFLLTAFVSFFTAELSKELNDIRAIIVMCTGILFFICYGLLISIFSYYKEPGWKKICIVIFLIGNIVFNILYSFSIKSRPSYNFILLIFYLPMITAFATVNIKEIKPLSLSFAYIMLIVCLLRIALPYTRNKINLLPYIYFLNAVFLLPPGLIVVLFHKMVFESQRNNDPEISEENDLL